MTLSGFERAFKRTLPIWVVGMLFLGFVFGLVDQKTAESLKVMIVPLSFVMIYMMCISLQPKQLVDVFKHPWELLLALGLSLVLAPLLMWPLGYLILHEHTLVLAGVLLAALVPPGGLTAFWAGIMNASVSFALMLEMLALMLSLVWVPLGMTLLAGAYVSIDALDLFSKIIILVVGPFIAGYVTRWILLRRQGEAGLRRLKPGFSIISGFAALMITFIALAVKAPAIQQQPAIIIRPAIVALLYYLITYGLTGWVTLRLIKIPYDKAIPMIYGTGTKNLSIAMGLSVMVFGPEALLGVIGCAVFQMPFASLFYKWFLRYEPRREETRFERTIEALPERGGDSSQRRDENT